MIIRSLSVQVLIKGCFNEIVVQMCVHLRGSNAAVAKQDLYEAQIVRLPDKMGGTGVPEHMRGQPELIL